MVSILMMVGLPLLFHCGGSSTSNIIEPTKTPVFTSSGTASAKDLVTLAFVETSPGSKIKLDVRLGGPTSSSDLSAFSFSLVLSDPSLVRSVTANQGTVFSGEQSFIANLVENKLVIGVTKLGGTGTGVAADGATILTVEFTMDPTKPGTTELAFSDMKVQDHTGAFITSITWDTLSAKLTQPQ